jgi:pimeloyl-ACP methyl ester carboxylesterase
MIPLSVEGGEIWYSDRGTGEPVVLVHAGVFSDWFLPLSESHTLDPCRVIRIRRAGYAGHEPSRHLTIADHAGHLATLAAHLGLGPAHWVGHSSGCQIVLQLALDHPRLVKTLILIEPAAGGGFVVPAVEELGRRFVGPAIGAFTAGDLHTAFDLFMRGVCGEHYRSVLEQRLGVNGVDEAIRQSAFFFRDEVPAVLESTFSPAQAARIRCPVLVVEGDDSAVSGPLSRQITALATELLTHAAVRRVAGTNHMMPLQDPDSVARLIQDFVNQQS